MYPSGIISLTDWSVDFWENFLGVENTIRIDAGTNPYAQFRFCLGRIANNKRNKMIEQVRTSIGRGIELSGGHQHSRGIFTLTSLDFIMVTRTASPYQNFGLVQATMISAKLQFW